MNKIYAATYKKQVIGVSDNIDELIKDIKDHVFGLGSGRKLENVNVNEFERINHKFELMYSYKGDMLIDRNTWKLAEYYIVISDGFWLVPLGDGTYTISNVAPGAVDALDIERLKDDWNLDWDKCLVGVNHA